MKDLTKQEIEDIRKLTIQVLEQLLKDFPETFKEIKEILDKKMNE